MKTKHKLRGIIPAVVTPMKENGDVDFKLLELQTKYLKDAGVNGFFVNGGTGEGAYLTVEEKKEIYHCVRSIVGYDVFICLAVLNSNTRAVLNDIKYMQDCDADFVVATTPFYHGADQNVIMEHFTQIAASSFAPVILYNIPSATSHNINLDTIYSLKNLDNIVGIKDSSGDFCQFSRGLFGEREEGFSWIQGEDYLCAPTFLCEGNGVVSGLSNAKAEPYVAMYQAHLAGDNKKVMECQKQINFIYQIIHQAGFKNGNAAIKAVGEIEGRGSKYMRQAGLTLNAEQLKKIELIVTEYNQKYC